MNYSVGMYFWRLNNLLARIILYQDLLVTKNIVAEHFEFVYFLWLTRLGVESSPLVTDFVGKISLSMTSTNLLSTMSSLGNTFNV